MGEREGTLHPHSPLASVRLRRRRRRAERPKVRNRSPLHEHACLRSSEAAETEAAQATGIHVTRTVEVAAGIGAEVCSIRLWASAEEHPTGFGPAQTPLGAKEGNLGCHLASRQPSLEREGVSDFQHTLACFASPPSNSKAFYAHGERAGLAIRQKSFTTRLLG